MRACYFLQIYGDVDPHQWKAQYAQVMSTEGSPNGETQQAADK